ANGSREPRDRGASCRLTRVAGGARRAGSVRSPLLMTRIPAADENGTKVATVRLRRSGHDKVVQSPVAAARVVAGERGRGIDILATSAFQGIGPDHRPCVVADAIVAVGVASQRVDTWCAVECNCQREQELGVWPPNPGAVAHGYRDFA